MRNCIALLLLPVLAGCSGDENSAGPAEGHVWQEQTDMIERAKGVEDLLGDANLQRRQLLDEQAQ